MLEALSGFFAAVLAVFGVQVPPSFSASPISYFSPPAPHVRILFGGDMMFDRTIRTTMDEKGGDFIFSCIDPVLKDMDFVIANLEGPITEHRSKSAGSTPGGEFNYTFTFPTSTAALLKRHNVSLVNLGNNHITNFGVSGLSSTTELLKAAGVGYFGLPAMSAHAEQAGDPPAYNVAAGSFGGVRLAFINYNEFGGDATTTRKQIRDARAAGELPVVYTHWGVEYATTSSAYSRELAHSFIDAGAEIVIGSHPHVVEEREFYKGKYIYYSLGNFIFDQYWNDDVRHGLLIKVAFTSNGVEWVQEIPVELGRDRRTCPALSTTTPLTES